MNRLFVDIESLPTDNPAHIADISASITPPASMSKADTLAKWEAETKPGLIAEKVAKTSFDGAYGRVCCIGWAWNDGPVDSLYLEGDETKFMRDAIHLIESQRPCQEAFHATQIVGHYVAYFDIRFLWQRAFVLGVKMPAFFPRDPKPWSKEVCDTMAVWAGSKGSISLDNLCKALGIDPMGDDELPGSEVAAAWARGEYDRVSTHCENDVMRVRQVYQKMQIALGERDG